MSYLGKYFQETGAELKQVRWPTKRRAVIYSALVIGISLIVALFLSAADYLFSMGLDEIINRFY